MAVYNAFTGGRLVPTQARAPLEYIRMTQIDARFYLKSAYNHTSVFWPRTDNDDVQARELEVLLEGIDVAEDHIIVSVIPPRHTIYSVSTELWAPYYAELAQAIYSPAADAVDFGAATGVVYELSMATIKGTVDPMTGVLSGDPEQNLVDQAVIPGLEAIKADDFSAENGFKWHHTAICYEGETWCYSGCSTGFLV